MKQEFHMISKDIYTFLITWFSDVQFFHFLSRSALKYDKSYSDKLKEEKEQLSVAWQMSLLIQAWPLTPSVTQS